MDAKVGPTTTWLREGEGSTIEELRAALPRAVKNKVLMRRVIIHLDRLEAKNGKSYRTSLLLYNNNNQISAYSLYRFLFTR